MVMGKTFVSSKASDMDQELTLKWAIGLGMLRAEKEGGR